MEEQLRNVKKSKIQKNVKAVVKVCGSDGLNFTLQKRIVLKKVSFRESINNRTICLHQQYTPPPHGHHGYAEGSPSSEYNDCIPFSITPTDFPYASHIATVRSFSRLSTFPPIRFRYPSSTFTLTGSCQPLTDTLTPPPVTPLVPLAVQETRFWRRVFVRWPRSWEFLKFSLVLAVVAIMGEFFFC